MSGLVTVSAASSIERDSGAWVLLAAGVVVPLLVAWVTHRMRGPAETREAALDRLAHERDTARAELHADNAELRSRLDQMEGRLSKLEEENRRLRAVEEYQASRIRSLERALRDAHIPIPPDDRPPWLTNS